ncbi:MAG: ROK family protein [Chthonomonadales bacterium]
MSSGTTCKYVVGVDLGGTNVRAAVIGENEKILAQAHHPSYAKLGADRVIEASVGVISEAIKAAGLKAEDIGAVGMAVPGHIDTARGVIRWSPNFGETKDGAFNVFLNVKFTPLISSRLGLPVTMGNDANVAALGEYRYGAGRDVKHMVMFTLGTGIGSGVIINGEVLIGSTGGAVELGHHVIVAGGVRCGCSTFGCIEAYCGQHAIVERALRAMENGSSTLLNEKLGSDKGTLTPEQIDEAARAGDAAAIGVFEETGYYLGIGMANSVHIFNPEMIVIGGGVRKATGLIESAKRSMYRHTIASLVSNVVVAEAGLGGDAGVMGAAELAWRLAGA